MATIANNRFPVGNPANFRELTKGKYSCYVYQGDKSDEQFMESAAVKADANIPTGTIAYIDADGFATTTKPTVTNGVAIPYIVKVGTDHRTVKSEKYNAAGGLVTLLPLTGYFRIVTTGIDATCTYTPGTYLCVKAVDGVNVLVPKGTASAGTDVVGIVDGFGSEVKQNSAVAFTAFFRPASN